MVASPIQVLACGFLALAAISPTAAPAATPNGSNATDSIQGLWVYDLKLCGNMYMYWELDLIKYACTWEHSDSFGVWKNHFYKLFDGNLLSECGCNTDLSLYNPSAPRWTRSTDSYVTCYTRDGKSAKQVRSQFDSINCPKPTLVFRQ